MQQGSEMKGIVGWLVRDVEYDTPWEFIKGSYLPDRYRYGYELKQIVYFEIEDNND